MKLEFALKSLQGGVNITQLCEDFGISKPTGYKWKTRFIEKGFAGLHELSRQPKSNPNTLTEDVICELIKLKNQVPRYF